MRKVMTVRPPLWKGAAQKRAGQAIVGRMRMARPLLFVVGVECVYAAAVARRGGQRGGAGWVRG